MKTSRRTFLALLSTLPLARALGFKGPALWDPHPAQKECLYSQDMWISFMGGIGCGAHAVLVNLSIPDYEGVREQRGTGRRQGRGRSQRGRRG